MFAAASSEFPNDNPCLHRGVCWVLASSDGPLVAERCQAPEAAGSAVPQAVHLEATEAASPVDDAPSAESGGHTQGCGDADVDEESEQTVPTPRVSETLAVGARQETERAEARVAVTEPLGEAAAEADQDTPAPPSETRRALPEDGFLRFVTALVEIAECEGAADQAALLPALLALEPVPAEALGAAAVRALLGVELCVEVDGAVRASERLSALVHAWSGVLRRTGDFSACGSVTLNEWAADLLAALLGDAQRASAMQYQLRRRGIAAFGMVQLAA
jgi:hypothetical protein